MERKRHIQSQFAIAALKAGKWSLWRPFSFNLQYSHLGAPSLYFTLDKAKAKFFQANELFLTILNYYSFSNILIFIEGCKIKKVKIFIFVLFYFELIWSRPGPGLNPCSDTSMNKEEPWLTVCNKVHEGFFKFNSQTPDLPRIFMMSQDNLIFKKNFKGSIFYRFGITSETPLRATKNMPNCRAEQIGRLRVKKRHFNKLNFNYFSMRTWKSRKMEHLVRTEV